MMYHEQFVAVVKVGNRFLREEQVSGEGGGLPGETRRTGRVRLPFGEEYTILLKNMSTQRAVVDVEIDGSDVLDGTQLVIAPNTELELKGFMKGDRARKAFKFIQKTEEIQEHRGDDVSDGFIRVQYALEKPAITWSYTYAPGTWTYTSTPGGTFTCSTTTGPHQVKSASTGGSISCFNCTVPASDEGITVAGSAVDQKFHSTSVGLLEPPNVIVLELVGAVGKQRVRKAVTTKTRLACKTCGRRWRSSQKFCGNCGTALDF